MGQQHTVHIKTRQIMITLVVLSLVFIVLSLTGQWFRLFPDSYSISGPTQEFFLDLFIDKFSVNTENNIPTYFNTAILLLAASLIFLIASARYAGKDRYRYEWILLGFVFLYLSIDESAVIHETFTKLFKDAPDINGWLHYKWVIPGSLAVSLLCLAFLRFFLHLETRYKLLFFLSSAVYLAGALGSELVSGRYANEFGTKSFTYSALTTVEESLEWFGVILLIFTLLKYIESHMPETNLHFNTTFDKKSDP
jgi:hypothetical protein